MRVKLGRDATTVIALTDNPQSLGLAAAERSVAQHDRRQRGALRQPAAHPRRAGGHVHHHARQRPHGRRRRSARAPAAIDLTAATWHLDAEDWQPQNPYGTLGDRGDADQQDPGLARPHRPEGVAGHPGSWRTRPGIGMYSTTVNLPAGWDASYGAVLASAR